MNTYLPTKAESEALRGWRVVDAEGKTLGRLATQIAATLRGKNKPQFSPHRDCGDFVVVVNANKIKFSGNKLAGKMYRRYSGFIGGLQEETAEELFTRKPEEVIRLAVWGMLPKGTLGRQQIKKLKVFAGPEHTHHAQRPEPL